MADYFSGQGKVYAAVATAGVPAEFRFLGNAPQFDVTAETDVLEHKESTTGARATDLRLLREKTMRVTMVLEEFTDKNLALALFGLDSTITGSSVSAETVPTMADNDYHRTDYPAISAVVIEDAVAAPLVLDTNYEITSADHGTIKFLDVAGFTQPFNIDYTYATSTNIKMLSEGLVERWIKFDGLNTANSDSPVLADLYRVAFDPAEALNLIGEDLGRMTLNGNLLNDDTKSGDVTLGTFGRIVLIT